MSTTLASLYPLSLLPPLWSAGMCCMLDNSPLQDKVGREAIDEFLTSRAF